MRVREGGRNGSLQLQVSLRSPLVRSRHLMEKELLFLSKRRQGVRDSIRQRNRQVVQANTALCTNGTALAVGATWSPVA